MVSQHTRRDRAQLLLIAAIAIAFIILGIAVALNTVLYTQTISSSNTVETAGNAEQVELELEQGLQRVIQDANRDTSTDEVVAAEEFVDLYQNRTAHSRPSLVTLDGITVIDEGTRIRDTGPAGAGEEIFNDSSSVQLGQFIVELDLVTLNGGSFDVDFEGETVSIGYDGSIVTVSTGSESCEYEPADDELTVELLTGEATGTQVDRTDCAELASTLRGEYEYVSFGNPNGAVDGYEVVVGADLGATSVNGAPVDVPWTTRVSLLYESKELSVERTLEVDVYGDRL